MTRFPVICANIDDKFSIISCRNYIITLVRGLMAFGHVLPPAFSPGYANVILSAWITIVAWRADWETLAIVLLAFSVQAAVCAGIFRISFIGTFAFNTFSFGLVCLQHRIIDADRGRSRVAFQSMSGAVSVLAAFVLQSALVSVIARGSFSQSVAE
jgi:hypothetical protein